MITDHQRVQRHKYLGSSDAPAIAGVNPWKNAADIYWDKIKPPSANPNEPQDDAIIVGNFCEEAVLNWFSKETGNKITRNQRRVHRNGIMAANLDAIVDEKPELVEAKTAGIITPFDRTQWGEIGTDQVPERVIVQCHHQMAVMGEEYRLVWVPVLLGGIGFRLYRVDRNDELIEHLFGLEVNFWKEYVLKRTPPPNQIPSFEILRKIHRQPNKIVPLNNELVNKWLVAKKYLSDAQEAESEAKKHVLSSLGDAEAGECDMGMVTFFEQKRKAYMVKESSHRVLRFKEPKENSHE